MSIIRKIFLLLFILFLAPLLLSGCFLLNNAPVIESLPKTSVYLGDSYTYDLEAIDPNDDTLSYLLKTYPEGMNINSSTGLVSWTPIESQIGEHEVEIEVSDGSKSTNQVFTITVEKVLLVSIEAVPSWMYLEIGDSKAISSVTAFYNNDTQTAIELTDCTYESDKPSIATVNSSGVVKGISSCTSSSAATITVSYTEDDLTFTDTISVIVSNPSPG